MTNLNVESAFNVILTKIENDYVKTTHQLRLILDGLSEEFNVSSLNLLVTFREWLMKKNIELSTLDGMVGINKLAN